MNQVSNQCSGLLSGGSSCRREMRPVFAAFCLFAALFSATPNASANATPAPLTFNVWLDERAMGTHVYRFQSPEPASNKLIVTSEANFKVKILFATVFSYQHKAIETWAGDCLAALDSETTTNGKQEAIELVLPDGDCAGTYTYWDKERLQRAVLTNAQNGKQEPATWTDLGAMPLPTIGKRKKIRGHSGNVQAVSVATPSASFMLYYSDAAELLMMQTENDSRTITYLHDSLTAR